MEWVDAFRNQLWDFDDSGPFTKDRVMELCMLMKESFALNVDYLVEDLLEGIFRDDCVAKFSVEELIKLRDMNSDERQIFRLGMRGKSVINIIEDSCFYLSIEQILVFEDVINWKNAANRALMELGRDYQTPMGAWKQILFSMKANDSQDFNEANFQSSP